VIEIPFKEFLIGRIPIRANIEEIRPLHAAHYAETEVKYKHHTVDVDYAHMAACDDAGTMRCFGARLVDSQQLCAYLFTYISKSAHDSSMVAMEDAYYVMPEYRGSGLARRLLQYSKKRLKELGVEYLFMSSKAPVGGPNIGLFLETEGFKAVAVSYMVEL
jgi:GNAT superfamily N-acetyltransferase